jgi:hypothetical protein
MARCSCLAQEVGRRSLQNLRSDGARRGRSSTHQSEVTGIRLRLRPEIVRKASWDDQAQGHEDLRARLGQGAIPGAAGRARNATSQRVPPRLQRWILRLRATLRFRGSSSLPSAFGGSGDLAGRAPRPPQPSRGQAFASSIEGRGRGYPPSRTGAIFRSPRRRCGNQVPRESVELALRAYSRRRFGVRARRFFFGETGRDAHR